MEAAVGTEEAMKSSGHCPGVNSYHPRHSLRAEAEPLVIPEGDLVVVHERDSLVLEEDLVVVHERDSLVLEGNLVVVVHERDSLVLDLTVLHGGDLVVLHREDSGVPCAMSRHWP